jgi:dTMP kinase
MNKGKFIVFEGIDASGKSTQIRMLEHYLKEKGVPVYLTREPTDSPFGALAHQCMTGRIDSDEKAIAAVMAADRLDHIYNKTNGLLDKINAGITVISDRYYFSSYAYQGAHLDMDWVIELNRLSAEALRPDVNIFIDIDAQTSMNRLQGRGDLERYEKLDKQLKVREQYFAAFDRMKNEENVQIVQSEKEPAQTQANIRKIVDKIFGF